MVRVALLFQHACTFPAARPRFCLSPAWSAVLEKLFDGQADVAGNLPQQRRCDVAAFVSVSFLPSCATVPQRRRKGTFLASPLVATANAASKDQANSGPRRACATGALWMRRATTTIGKSSGNPARRRHHQEAHSNNLANTLPLKLPRPCAIFLPARAHGLWTYEPRQGRKAATAVCSASAVVTLALEFRMRSAECGMKT